jgi:formylglycine-generating enzyme required for sulfatase activity
VALCLTALVWTASIQGAAAEDNSPPAPFDCTTEKEPADTKAAQAAWAKHLKTTVEVNNALGMKFRLIPPGSYLRGSTKEQVEAATRADKAFTVQEGVDEQPQHTVELTQPFFLGSTEVTRGQFRKFVTAAKYVTEPERDGEGGFGFNAAAGQLEGRRKQFTWKGTGFPQTDSHPVVNITWTDAQAFCNWLSEKEQRRYRLPTEAEWEYACRAGTLTTYSNGDEAEGLVAVANVADGTARAKFQSWSGLNAKDGAVYTQLVGKYRTNAFGLADMHGNVCEWCADRYSGNDYAPFAMKTATDPQGAMAGNTRIVRGGGWNNTAGLCRSASRRRFPPSDRYDFLGFRVVLELPE